MKKPDTKTILLDAAEWAARRHGHDGFSYADLSKRVGIRTASIHYHFPAKADLITALMARYKNEVAENLAQIIKQQHTGGTQILRFLDLYRTALNGGDTLCLCVALSVGRDTLAKATLQQIVDFRGQTLVWLQEVFARAAQDSSIRAVYKPSAEAAAALALVEGAQISPRSEQNLHRFDRATDLMRQRLHTDPPAGLTVLP